MFLALLAACSDPGLTKYNNPPNVSLTDPEDGFAADPGTMVEFEGLATDGQDLATELLIVWSSTIDGPIGSDPPDISGNVYLATNALSSGDHLITLMATDTEGESSSQTIAVSIADQVSSAGAPTVVILGPTPDQEVPASEGLSLIATVTDDVDPYETLSVEVVDVPDGIVWTGNPLSTGTLQVELDPSEGTHTLNVNATDSEGKTGTASVAYTVLADDRPKVSISSPADGAVFDVGEEISFRGVVSDDATAAEDLAVTWASDRVGIFSSNPADSSGDSSFATALPAGVHTITLAAVDGDGKSGSNSIVLTVEDPLDRDDDHDGFSENAGDCDDTDSTIAPDASDVCDEIDNDCSGGVNESYWDTYEPNDTVDAAYDLGEVSGFLWTSDTITLSGLTMSDPEDGDWFIWDANDELIVDNVNIVVSATGFSGKGDYVIELWWLDEDQVIDSQSGNGSLGLSYEGDLLDDEEDHWAIHVYANSWPTGTCSTDYTLTIHS